MQIVTGPHQLREALDEVRRVRQSVGFVPTMGYLHDGHVSLMEKSSSEDDVTVVSIFVNPLQFGASEDLDKYPRDDVRDEAILESAGVDFLFRPSVADMYGDGAKLTISTSDLGRRLCGASRPGHFDGVATVVAKLFNIVGPCRAYFGEKDFQQLTLLRLLAKSFDFPVGVVGLPTVRDPDGLAMSSRNSYLSAKERSDALAIPSALFAARDAVAAGERNVGRIVEMVRDRLNSISTASVDYVAVVDPETLDDLQDVRDGARLLVAVRMPSARLIDNISLT